MTKPTIRNINTALRRSGIPLELVRGDGYHYFVYDVPARNIYETHSVMVPYTSHMSVGRWLVEALGAINIMNAGLRYRDTVIGAVRAALTGTEG